MGRPRSVPAKNDGVCAWDRRGGLQHGITACTSRRTCGDGVTGVNNPRGSWARELTGPVPAQPAEEPPFLPRRHDHIITACVRSEVITVRHLSSSLCGLQLLGRMWPTGALAMSWRGVRLLFDMCDRVNKLYGPPGFRGPSCCRRYPLE